jgi:hypothetical protein
LEGTRGCEGCAIRSCSVRKRSKNLVEEEDNSRDTGNAWGRRIDQIDRGRLARVDGRGEGGERRAGSHAGRITKTANECPASTLQQAKRYLTRTNQHRLQRQTRKKNDEMGPIKRGSLPSTRRN